MYHGILFFFDFFPTTQNLESILSPQNVQQAVGWIWPAGYSVQTPAKLKCLDYMQYLESKIHKKFQVSYFTCTL